MSKRSGELSNGTQIDHKRRRHEDILTNPVGENGVSQCFRKVKLIMNVYAAPVFAGNPIEGIRREHLDPMILQYDTNAGGVVVAYNNVKLLKKKGTPKPQGEILSESPFSFHWISVELVVWYPQQGDVLEAWISVQSPGHLALLIHDTFNATVKRNDIPASWTFVPQEDDEADSEKKSLGYWQDSEGNRIDGKLQFTVKRFLHGGRTPLVLGSLLTDEDLAAPQYDESQYDNNNYSNDQQQQDETNDNGGSSQHNGEHAEESEGQKPKKIKFD